MDQKGPFKKGQIEDPIIATTSPDAAMHYSQRLIHSIFISSSHWTNEKGKGSIISTDGKKKMEAQSN